MARAKNAHPTRGGRAAEGIGGFLAYAGELLRVCVRDRAILIALVAAQLLLLLPMAVGYPMTEETLSRDRAKEMLGITKNLRSTYGSELPAELAEYNERQRRHYADAVDAAYPSQEYFAAMAAAQNVEIEEWQAGYRTGGIYDVARAKLLEALAEYDEPKVYRDAAQLPAVEYLALALGVMPAACTLLPSLLGAARVVSRLRGRRFLACAPVGRLARWAGAALASIALSLACLLATALPATLVAGIRNGMGDPSYPLVTIMADEVVASTVGAAVAQDMALLALGAIGIALLMCLIGRTGPGATLAAGIAATVAPLLPFYSLASMPWAAIGTWLPTSYLRLDQVVGHLTYANGLDIAAFPQATPGRGIAVLACTSLLICLVAGTAGAVRSARDAARLTREAS